MALLLFGIVIFLPLILIKIFLLKLILMIYVTAILMMPFLNSNRIGLILLSGQVWFVLILS